MGLNIFILVIFGYNAVDALSASFSPWKKYPLRMRLKEKIGRD
jgi:hypothetical protein